MSFATRIAMDAISTAIVAGWEISAGGRDVTGKDLQIWEYRAASDTPPAPGARVEIVIESISAAKGIAHWNGKAAILVKLPTRIDAKNEHGDDQALKWTDEIRNAVIGIDHASLQVLQVSLDAIESKGVAGIGGLPRSGPWQDDGSETVATLTAHFLIVSVD